MIKVNYILQHKNAFIKISKDKDITTIDIAIYNALFLLWNKENFPDELQVNRTDVMLLSKVGNKNTYTASLKRLNDKGYIKYMPSYNPLIGSKISITIFGKGSGKSSDISSGNGGGISCGDGGGTFYKQYKQYNTLTKKHINIILDYFDSLPYDVLNEKLKELNHVSDNEKIDFSVFWELYGKKKGNKLKVEKKWNKLSLSTQEKIIETLPDFKKSISDIQYLPFPETYLNNERWNDEIEETLQEEKTGYVRKYDWDSYLKTLEDE